jgi:adenylylsulfate kinase
MRILVFGLPGSGKTHFSQQMMSLLGNKIAHLNADEIRSALNDWDFSDEGRIRQARRMREHADALIEEGIPSVVADFVCPTPELREIYDADLAIWMDTIERGRFEDTNKAWVVPTDDEYDIRITEFLSEEEVTWLWETLSEAIHQQD